MSGVQEVLKMPTPALHAHEQRPAERCVAFIMRHKQHEVCKLMALKQCNVCCTAQDTCRHM